MAVAMLAPPPQPMPPTTIFAEYFLDTTNNHFLDHYPELMLAFNISVNPSSPDDLQDLVAKATAQKNAVCFVALVDNKLQLFLLPFRINLDLGASDGPYSTGKLIAFQGNVLKGVGSLVSSSHTRRLVQPHRKDCGTYGSQCQGTYGRGYRPCHHLWALRCWNC